MELNTESANHPQSRGGTGTMTTPARCSTKYNSHHHLRREGEIATLGLMRVIFRFAAVFVLALIPCSLTACTSQAARRTARDAATSDRIVVMISLDGLAGFYLDDPNAKMPNLRALAAQGVSAKMKASNPTVTWPNHTTLVTGVEPARHGVIGNNYFDRATSKPVVLIGDPVLDKDQMVKTPTIYDVAHAAGMKTAAILWPASRNAKSLDWTIPDVHEVPILEKYATPGLLAEAAASGIPSPLSTKENVDQYLIRDDSDTKIFNLILREKRPRLALLHLVNVDHMQHLKGPRSPEAYAAIEQIDAHVREVWNELKRDYPDNATLIIVSDHGFSAIEHAIFPNVILRKAGLIEVKGPRIVGGDVNIVPQGGSAMLYFTAGVDRDKTAARVTQAFAGIKGIRKIVPTSALKEYGLPDPQSDPHAPDMLLLAEEGYVFGDTAAGELPFVEKPERLGSHGHDATIPDLRATFVAWGAGIRHTQLSGDVQNIDVAPTIAKLLNLDMPNVDGKPISAILSAP